MRIAILWMVGLALLASCTDSNGPDPPAPIDTASRTPATTNDVPQPAPDTATVAQTIYVPVYSHIYFRDGGRQFDLTATLSVRNTDPEHSITIGTVRYHDSGGSAVRQYLDQPVVLAPLASRAFVIAESDKTGGVGANFIVEWHAARPVSQPIAESVMISTASAQGISFTSRGIIIEGKPLPPRSAGRIP